MLYTVTLVVISQLLFISNAVAAEGGNAKQIASAAIEELEASGTPSLQIAIARGGEIVYQGAFGYADLENQVRASNESRYRTASVAKWFTATAMMRLSESGKLDLDAPVSRYCPEYPDKAWPISARQLASHTGGVRGYVDSDINAFHLRYTDTIGPLANFRDEPLSFEPGTQWQYTSFGYQLLGCVIQGAAGISYRDAMRDLVFRPAGMDTTLADDAWTIIPGRVQGYRLQRGESVRRADYRDVSANLPAGGYLSTATDLVKFVSAYNSELLSEESRILMRTPVLLEGTEIAAEKSWRDAIPAEGQYGYGIMLFTKYGDGLIGHTGRQAGASAILLHDTEKNVSIAVLSNAKGWNGYLPFSMKLLEIVQQEARASL